MVIIQCFARLILCVFFCARHLNTAPLMFHHFEYLLNSTPSVVVVPLSLIVIEERSTYN